MAIFTDLECGCLPATGLIMIGVDGEPREVVSLRSSGRNRRIVAHARDASIGSPDRLAFSAPSDAWPIIETLPREHEPNAYGRMLRIARACGCCARRGREASPALHILPHERATCSDRTPPRVKLREPLVPDVDHLRPDLQIDIHVRQ